MDKYNKNDYLFLIEKVKALYENSRDDNLEDFPISEREKFHKNGNRQDFEKLYFKRRDYLSAAAVLALFDKKYIHEVERIILAVCDEYCWALPAHTTGVEVDGKKVLDLFVAETSFALAEICYVFKGEISPEVYGRVQREIKTRLLGNYVSNTYWWENCNMNWAAVCGGYAGGALLYMFPDEFLAQKTRILKTLKCYIDGFTEDGFCLEGPSYWQYGFMAYTVFADILYRFSGCKDDLFWGCKVKNIASYGGNCILRGNTAVSFSDSQMDFKAEYALQSYLYNRFSETVPYIGKDNLCIGDANTKWINFYRVIIWQSLDGAPMEEKNNVAYSPFANQLIVNESAYSFAFKGGNNDEPHNHNDLGSFIYSDKDGQVFCDLGSGRYTKDYFDDSKRYGIFCNSSLSHSVPLINGRGQVNGKEFTARLTYENDVCICDLSSAYNEDKLQDFWREVQLKENGVVLKDSFEGDVTVTERFVSLRRATEIDGALLFGGTRLCYPKNKVTLTVKEEKHTPHQYDGSDVTVYCYDFFINEGATDISFEITTI